MIDNNEARRRLLREAGIIREEESPGQGALQSSTSYIYIYIYIIDMDIHRYICICIYIYIYIHIHSYRLLGSAKPRRAAKEGQRGSKNPPLRIRALAFLFSARL